MASSEEDLLDSDISQVTDIVSADNRLRFCTEYLGIDRNEYKTIEADAKYFHHDTLFECIRRWKNKTEAEGSNPKEELIKILSGIRKERGWFSAHDMVFLHDGAVISDQSKSTKSNDSTQNEKLDIYC